MSGVLLCFCLSGSVLFRETSLSAYYGVYHRTDLTNMRSKGLQARLLPEGISNKIFNLFTGQLLEAFLFQIMNKSLRRRGVIVQRC